MLHRVFTTVAAEILFCILIFLLYLTYIYFCGLYNYFWGPLRCEEKRKEPEKTAGEQDGFLWMSSENNFQKKSQVTTLKFYKILGC